ncbi:MAG: hypothetical protein LBD15_01615 [Holosporales bacterium]|jgi:hypothetical protein|nr:hypothetical protein [Holosporales bacterium]
MATLKHKHTFVGLLGIVTPLGFLPILPNRLYLMWFFMFQGLLMFPEPSYLGLWIECLCFDFFYDIPIGTSFLSFSMICLSVEISRKHLPSAPFVLLWGVTTIVAVGLDILLFQSVTLQTLMQKRSWVELGWMIGGYPLVVCGIKMFCRKQVSAAFQYNLFE